MLVIRQPLNLFKMTCAKFTRIFIITTLWHLVNCKISVFQTFGNPNLKHITICNCNKESTDEFDYEFVDILNQKDLWLNLWDCLYSDIPEFHNGIIILNQITQKDMMTIFAKEGIQSSLKGNIWLIHAVGSTIGIVDFFEETPIKIGLNAKIFIIDHSNNVIQIIGNGRHSADSKVRNI